MKNEINMKIYSLLCLLLIINVCCSSIDTNTGKNTNIPYWELAYSNSYDGSTLFGDKEKLIELIRQGSPLRIGFGGHRKNDTLISIEHFADAQFVTITNSNEVFAQISTMTFKESSEWSMIACTNGQISTLSIDYIIDSLSTPKIQNRSTSPNTQNRGFSWYVQRSYLPVGYKHNKIEPLWKNPREQ